MDINERAVAIYLLGTIVYSILAAAIFEIRWWAGLLPVALISAPLYMVEKTMERCNRDHFKIKLLKVMGAIIVFCLCISIPVHFLFPPALLSFQTVGCALAMPHSCIYTEMMKKMTRGQAKLLISLKIATFTTLFMMVLVPLTAWSLTLSWTATLLPLFVMSYCDEVICGATTTIFEGASCRLGLRNLIAAFLMLSTLFTTLTAVSFALSSTFFTATNALIAMMCFSMAVHFARTIVKRRRKQGKHHLEILISCVVSVAASVVVGAARSASPQPIVWEIGGSLVVLLAGLMISFELDKERHDTDEYLERPKEMNDWRHLLTLCVYFAWAYLMGISILLSAIYRALFPSRSSSMPLIICIFLIFIMFLLDNTREYISQPCFRRSGLCFSVVSILLLLAGIVVFFFAYSWPAMEALVSSLIVSICLFAHCWRSHIRMDYFATVYLTAQQAAVAQQQQYLQNYIPNYFQVDFAPGG